MIGTATIFATLLMASAGGDLVLTCKPGDESQTKSARVHVTFEDSSNPHVMDADVRIVPVSGFEDPAEIFLRNVQGMTLKAGPGYPPGSTFDRLASGMGGERGASPWRISMVFPVSGQPDTPIRATLRKDQGSTTVEYTMICIEKPGAAQ